MITDDVEAQTLITDGPREPPRRYVALLRKRGGLVTSARLDSASGIGTAKALGRLMRATVASKARCSYIC